MFASDCEWFPPVPMYGPGNSVCPVWSGPLPRSRLFRNSPRKRRYPCGWNKLTRCRSDSTASLSCTRAALSCSIQEVCCLTSSFVFCSSRRTSSITWRRNSSGSVWLAAGFWLAVSDEAPLCDAALAGPAAALAVVEVEGFSGAAGVPLSPVFAEVLGCAAVPADGLVAFGFCFAAARLRGAGEVCARTAQGRSRHTAASAERRRMRSLSTRTEAAQVTWRGGRVKKRNRELTSHIGRQIVAAAFSCHARAR